MTAVDVLEQLKAHPYRESAGVNLFQVLEHMIGGRISSCTLRREPGGPAYPRTLMALVCLEGAEVLVKAEPPLPRVEREAIAAATLALAQDLLLPDLPATLSPSEKPR